MKPLILFAFSFLLLCLFNSCKKELSCENCLPSNGTSSNKPPIANAGPDQTFNLPKDSTLLNGSLSSDPDGTIVSYKWTKISGPSSPLIVNAQASQTIARTLMQGTYVFELLVTDNGGLSAKDTVQIIVNNSLQNNKAPIANAGTDIAVVYNYQTCSIVTGTVSLNGTASSDPDGTIVSYMWTNITEPTAFIVNPTGATTQLNNVQVTTYKFRLEVTDNGGLTDDDTVVVKVTGINRPELSAQLVAMGTLSQKRYGMAMASIGNIIVFAGGVDPNGFPSSRVDIFNSATNAWSTAELSQARQEITTAVSGNKIYFAGGFDNYSIPYAAIDIYDVVSNTWTTAQLSQARSGMAATAVGTKILFGGGYSQITSLGDFIFSNKVDIYDAATNVWSTSTLSSARGFLTANTLGTRAFFAGGAILATVSDYTSTAVIDIYDAAANSWSTSSLNEGKGFHAAITANNKIYWAGGIINAITNTYSYMSNQVEIRDANSQTNFACLFQPNAGVQPVLKDNKIVFGTNNWNGIPNKFDIYDITTNTWYIGVFSQQISGPMISSNNIIYMAGVVINNILSGQVYRLEF